MFALGASYNTYDAPSIVVNNECDEDRNVGLDDSNPCDMSGDSPPGATFFKQALALFRFPSEDVQIRHVEVLNLFVSLLRRSNHARMLNSTRLSIRTR